MDFIKFFNSIVRKESEPIKQGDLCRNKETGVRSICLNIHQGLFYGRDAQNRYVVGKIENFEKVDL